MNYFEIYNEIVKKGNLKCTIDAAKSWSAMDKKKVADGVKKVARVQTELQKLLTPQNGLVESEWNRFLAEVQKAYKAEFDERLKLLSLKFYTSVQLDFLMDKFPGWSESKIRQEISLHGISFIETNSVQAEDTEFSLKSLDTQWNEFKRSTGIAWDCVSSSVSRPKDFPQEACYFDWLYVVRYWQFICLAFVGKNPQEMPFSEDVSNARGLNALSQALSQVDQINSSESARKGQPAQVALQTIVRFLMDCCKDAKDFRVYKNRMYLWQNEKLCQKIENLCDRRNSTILNFDAAVDMARARNIRDPEKFVVTFLASIRVNIPQSYNPKQADRRVSCPSCGTLNDPENRICSRCGFRFRRVCPRCKHEQDGSCAICVKCRLPLDMIERLKKEANLELADRKYDRLDALCKQMRVHWPENPDLNAFSEVLKKVEEERTREAMQRFSQAIDFRGRVQAALEADRTVQLAWNSWKVRAGSPMMSVVWGSCVVRKRDAVPASPEDGKKLITLGNVTRYEDTTVTPGEVYGYTVFPIVNGTVLSSGISSQQMLIPCGVQGLSTKTESTAVHLQWKKPGNCIRVEVFRKEGGILKAPKEGVPLPSAGLDGLIDRQVKTGVMYAYLIRPILRGPLGEEVLGLTQVITAVPCPPPPPVMDLRVSKEGNAYRLSWLPPREYTVKLYASAGLMGNPGKEISLSGAASLPGHLISGMNSEKGSALFSEKFVSSVYITPVTFAEHVAVLGKGVEILDIPEISNFVVNRNSNEMNLHWNWPAGCQEVLMVFRKDRFSESPTDQNAQKVSITKKFYEIENAHQISSPGEGSYYFTIYSVITTAGRGKVYSNGVRYVSHGTNSKTVYSWQLVVKKDWLLFGKEKFFLKINLKSGSRAMPEMLLKMKTGQVPLNLHDGFSIMEIPAGKATSLEQEIPVHLLEDNAYLKLFIKHPDEIYQLDNPRSNTTLVHLS